MWKRVEFTIYSKDTRPHAWPPPGPYWVTGGGLGYSTLAAYVPAERFDHLTVVAWPGILKAGGLDAVEDCETIEFTEEFQRPHWWTQSD